MPTAQLVNPTEAFLSALYPQRFPKNATLEVRALFHGTERPLTDFYGSVAEVCVDAPRLAKWNAEGRSIYFGASLRNGFDGTKAGCLWVPALWVDLDGKDFAGGKAAILGMLKALPPELRPSVIVDTGGGYQAYWPLREPYHLNGGGADTQRIERALRGLQRRLGADPSRTDVSSILRLPGFFNRKPEYDPQPVACIVACEPGRRFGLEDFDLIAASALESAGSAASGEHDLAYVDLVRVFRERELYIRKADSRKHYVRCPWIQEHSAKTNDTETAIWSPEYDGAPWGFKCQHAHCSTRTVRDVFLLFTPGDEPVTGPLVEDQRGEGAQDGPGVIVGAIGPTITAPVHRAPVLGDAAYHGPVGAIVRALDGKTEAHPATIGMHLLTGFGNLVDRGPCIMVGDTRHHANFFAAHVGQTAQGAKGLGGGIALRILTRVDPEWAGEAVLSSLSTGEGLINRVRDKEDKDGNTIPTEKRLFFLEQEFGRLLSVKSRDGSTLGPVLQDAWDGIRILTVTTKNQPLRAANAHISGCVHVTAKELSARLSDVDRANGFANRFMWIAVSRVASIPRPEPFNLDHPAVAAMKTAAAWVRSEAHASGELQVTWSDEGGTLWDSVYEPLRTPAPGAVGELLGRLASQVMRLAMVYALLDRSPVIGPEHLVAALAWKDYAVASLELAFYSETGDPIADKVLDYLREHRTAKRADIYDRAFNRKVKSSELDAARGVLLDLKLIRADAQPTAGGGWTVEIWALK